MTPNQWERFCRSVGTPEQRLANALKAGDPTLNRDDVMAVLDKLAASKPSEPAQDEALKADAARYRVVRGDGADANNAPLRDYCFDADGSLLYGHDLDAACDAALAQIDALEKPPEAQGSSGSLPQSGVEAGTQDA